MNIASKGRYGDTMLAHVAPGEMILPREVAQKYPDVAAAIMQAIAGAGGDPSRYIVGSDSGSYNPETGMPEFFFKKLFKAVKKIALPALAIAAPFVIPGVGAALSGALAGSGGLGGALTTGAKILGAVNTAKGLFSRDKQPQINVNYPQIQQQSDIPAAQAEEFTPERPNEISRPTSLNEFSSFSPQQERASLATQGLNQGLGSEENQYYRNLLQRSLIGEGNQVQQQDNFLLPIESQYFSRQGMDTSNIMNFLKAIRG